MLDLLTRIDGTPAMVSTDLHTVLIQNPLAIAMLGDLSAHHGRAASFIYRWFTDPASRQIYPPEDLAPQSRSFVADLRAAIGRRSPGDAEATKLVDELLQQSPEFQALWTDQDVGVRRDERKRIVHPTVGMLDLNLLGSARVRRERYTGEWIPEPLPERTDWISGRPGTAATGPADPADRVTLDESVSMAFLVALESMTPAQRVALILHDVFGYPFAEIAGITGRTPAACRELASSARRRVRASLPPAAPAAHQAGLVRDFKQAWDAQDINALIRLLAPGATFTADGGGVVAAALHPIEGGEGIARYLTDLAVRASGGLTVLERTVNGRAGLVIEHEDVTVAVYAFDVADDRITHIWAVRNPDKLRPWTAG
ncbi:sigma factor-like helix-turn-helix DNA-binding protein [Streptomyces sp. NPDC053750]|uniref:MmyB family transcriptional regulator n=1 Tax=Streptomyces sp. NPDC053750 TaxID=3365714 RepID=UPI0037D09D82